MVNTTLIRVFVSCPGDVSREKDIIKKLCESRNHVFSVNNRGIMFQVLDFKDIVAPWGNRSQEDINIRFSGYDIYIGLLWMRYGTVSGAEDPITGIPYGSGTEEEFRNAVQKRKDGEEIGIYFFFKEPRDFKDEDEKKELSKVKKFKREIQGNGWVHSFPNTEDPTKFITSIYQILDEWVWEVERKKRIEGKNEFIEEIKESTNTSDPIDFSRFIIGVQPYKNVIHRTLSPFDTKADSIDVFFGAHQGKELVELVEKESRIVLLGGAGSGKSTELSNLAAIHSVADSPFVPVFQRMNTYVNENIEDFLPEHWDKIPENICLVILDGLDEIEPANFNTAVRKINSFSSKFQNIRIVIACRTNFYEFPSGISGGTLSDFNVYLFDEINIKSIVTYANDEYHINGSDFVQEAYDKDFKDLITQPFFLQLLLEKYKTHKNLKISKVDLLNEFIDKRFDLDQQHFRGTTNLKLQKVKVMGLLRKVALTMEFMGKNYVTFDQLSQILPEPAELELLKFSTTFKNFDADPKMWGFEHNNIQEFLAASSLHEMTVEEIKGIISFKGKIIKPSWVNTLFFLMSIIDSEKRKGLIEWILNIDPEILVKIEPDKIDAKIRLEIFTNIFNHYKKQGVWLRSNKFTPTELARFAPVKSANEFLLKELLDKNNTRYTRLNAIHLIDDQILGSQENVKTKEALRTFIFEDVSDVHYFNATAYAMGSLKYADQELIDELMTTYGKSNNQYIRSGMYRLIHKAKLESKYVDYLIEGLNISEIDPDREKVNLIDESMQLEEAFSAKFEIDALRKILKYFSDDNNKRMLFRLDHRERVLRSIIDHSADLYTQYPDIYDLISKAYKYNIRLGDEKSLDIFSNFFIETKTSLMIFKEVFGNSDISSYERARLYKKLINKDVTDYVIRLYNEHDLTNNKLLEFYNEVKWYGSSESKDELLYLEKEIRANSKILNNVSEPKVTEAQKEWAQKNTAVFFSPEQFKQELVQFFDQNNIGELTWDLLYNHKKYDETDILHSPFELLAEYTRGGNTVNLKQVLDFVEQTGKFEDYLFNNLKDKLAGDSRIELTKSQIDQLADWVKDRVSKADIKNAITVNDGDRSRVKFNRQVQILWYYISRFDINVDKEKILDFTTYDDLSRSSESLDFSVIEKQVGKQEVTRRVIENLKNDIHYDTSWKNNAIYAVENGLEDAYPFILTALAGIDHDHYAKNEVLRAFDKFVEDPKDLLSLLYNVPNDSIKWEIINLILVRGSYKNEITEFLTILIENNQEPEQEKYRASQQLTRVGDPAGTLYYLNYMLNHSDDDCEDEFDFYYDAAYLKNVTDLVYLPKIMDLLKIAKTKKDRDDFDRLENYVTEVLANMAGGSEEGLNKVTEALRLFVVENQGIIEHINFFYPFIERLEHQFYLAQSQKGDIKTALAEVAKILHY
ncbi:NACHT domain-containing protein [Chryseobacterium sp. KCF3-3]|uniref:NACHT domain-containing protein n=1 Tax=Chryseobacterium sp. KCF3-3 TaxID=3231511 RepID=UPI0038B33360